MTADFFEAYGKQSKAVRSDVGYIRNVCVNDESKLRNDMFTAMKEAPLACP